MKRHLHILEQIAAYHETGHAVASLLLTGKPPVLLALRTDGGGFAITQDCPPRQDLIVLAAGEVGAEMIREHPDAARLWRRNARLLERSTVLPIADEDSGDPRAPIDDARESARVYVRLAAHRAWPNDFRQAMKVVADSRLDRSMTPFQWYLWALRKARRLLRNQWPALHAIARELLMTKALLGGEVKRLADGAT